MVRFHHDGESVSQIMVRGKQYLRLTVTQGGSGLTHTSSDEVCRSSNSKFDTVKLANAGLVLVVLALKSDSTGNVT